MLVAERTFDDYFRDCYPGLVAFGASMSGDREVARELAQETMLRAHRRWDELQEYDHPAAWSRRVMSNLLIDRFRSNRAERSAHDRVDVPLVADIDGVAMRGDGDTPVRSAGGAVERWAELISPLTARQRVIATMYYAEDESVAAIAAALDMSTGAVKSALFKIRRRLRRSIGEEATDG